MPFWRAILFMQSDTRVGHIVIPHLRRLRHNKTGLPKAATLPLEQRRFFSTATPPSTKLFPCESRPPALFNSRINALSKPSIRPSQATPHVCSHAQASMNANLDAAFKNFTAYS